MSAEGRVEHQKHNQTTALLFGWVFGVKRDLVENKCSIWRRKPYKASFGWISGVQLDLLEKSRFSLRGKPCRLWWKIFKILNCVTLPLGESNLKYVEFTEGSHLFECSLYTVFRARWVTFFPVNRVEHQKLNQTTPYGAVWLSFWCSTRPSADGCH